MTNQEISGRMLKGETVKTEIQTADYRLIVRDGKRWLQRLIHVTERKMRGEDVEIHGCDRWDDVPLVMPEKDGEQCEYATPSEMAAIKCLAKVIERKADYIDARNGRRYDPDTGRTFPRKSSEEILQEATDQVAEAIIELVKEKDPFESR